MPVRTPSNSGSLQEDLPQHYGIVVRLALSFAAMLHQLRGEVALCRERAEAALQWLALLAEAYLEAGRIEEGISAVREALAEVEETAARYYDPELDRLEGELVLASNEPDEGGAKASFRKAIAIARAQQAKAFELRAALSLARLWRHQGRRDAARDLLAPVYGWFTEGFDTADLMDAKALLDKLS
jgi:predicted ATPase